MIARICHRCHEYVTVTENYSGQLRVKSFQRDHASHPLGTANARDLAEYTNVNSKYDKIANEPE